MLVITRKPRQGFYITDDIYVCITSMTPGQVKIGIKAPESMSIMREELIDKASTHPTNAGVVDTLNQQKEYRRLQKQLERMRVCCSSA